MPKNTNPDAAKQERIERIKRITSGRQSNSQTPANSANTSKNSRSSATKRATSPASNQQSNQNSRQSTVADDMQKANFRPKNYSNYTSGYEKLGEMAGLENDNFDQQKYKRQTSGFKRLEMIGGAFTSSTPLTQDEKTQEYLNKLTKSANRNNRELQRLQQQKQKLNEDVSLNVLNRRQLEQYAVELDAINKKIEKLNQNQHNIERRLLHVTNKDFEGKNTNNIVDSKSKIVNDKARQLNQLKQDYANIAMIGVAGDSVATKEILMKKKAEEIEKTKKELEAAQKEVERANRWTENEEDHDKVLQWQEQEEKEAQKEWKNRHTFFGQVSADCKNNKTYLAEAKKNNRFNYFNNSLQAPLRSIREKADSAYSSAGNQLISARTKSAVNNAFSSAGNAINRMAHNAKATTSHALAEAGKAVFMLLKKFFIFLFTTPPGHILLVIFLIFLVAMVFSDPTKSNKSSAVEEPPATDILEDDHYSNDDNVVYMIRNVRDMMLPFASKYRVSVSPTDVGALILSSVDTKEFYELTKDNYKEYIDDLLKQNKVEMSSEIFLKEVDYRYYYLTREWEDWEVHERWLCPDDPDPDNPPKTPEPDGYDEVSEVYAYVPVEKDVPDPNACDVYYPVNSFPDSDDYFTKEKTWYFDWSTWQWVEEWEEVFDSNAYNRAISRYNDSVRTNDNCHRDPKSYNCTRREDVWGKHWVWQTRNFTSEEWVLAEDPTQVPADAEKLRDTLKVEIDEKSQNGLTAISDADQEDRGEWVWFNPLDSASRWAGNTNYYLKKEKFWVRWSMEELASLLGEEYNIYQTDNAPVQPEGHETFHKEGHNIYIYDTEGVPQNFIKDDGTEVPAVIDLDEFFKRMTTNQQNIYDNNKDTQGKDYVISELKGTSIVLQTYLGGVYGYADILWPMDPSEVSGIASCAGYRNFVSGTGSKDHGGDDINSFRGMGTQITAAAPGEVIYVYNGCNSVDAYAGGSWKPGTPAACMGSYSGGNQVWTKSNVKIDGVEHTVIIKYLHMVQNSLEVSEGETVEAGQALGSLGSSGCSTGAHLHFEIRLEDGSYIEPALSFDWSQVSIPPKCGASVTD